MGARLLKETRCHCLKYDDQECEMAGALIESHVAWGNVEYVNVI